MVEVDGYVCCEHDKRQHLRDLVQGIHAFAGSPRDHVSCMLIAGPGSGKTFLVRSLAETAGLRFLPFNITQMRSRSDVVGCFDAILAAQAESRRGRLLVFVDEINAELQGGSAYSAFLAPLEDGAYVHGGKTFHLDPCAWIFAGTASPLLTDVDKGSDFVSRLSLGMIALYGAIGPDDEQSSDGLAEVSGLRALENVYIGASMLRAEYPDVRRASEHVLRSFRKLSSTATVRDIKHFVRRFRYIQFGRVTSANVPDLWPRDLEGTFCEAWKTRIPEKEEADIEIVDV